MFKKTIVIVLLAAAGSLIGMSGYGLLAQGLGPMQTALWIANRIKVDNRLHPADAEGWIAGETTFFDATTNEALRPDTFLHQTKDGRRSSTLRAPVDALTLMRFDVTSLGEAVSTVYVLHRGDKEARVLYAGARPQAVSSTSPLRVPADDHLIRLEGGPTTEHFVLVAAKKELPAVARLIPEAGSAAADKVPVVQPEAVDAALQTIERDPDAYVLHVFIPHS